MSEGVKEVLRRILSENREVLNNYAEVETILRDSVTGRDVREANRVMEALRQKDISGIFLAADKTGDKASYEEAKPKARPRMQAENISDGTIDTAIEDIVYALGWEQWTCICGRRNDSEFCTDCGRSREEAMAAFKEAADTADDGYEDQNDTEDDLDDEYDDDDDEYDEQKPVEMWTCTSCGFQENHGSFCIACGNPRPADTWVCLSCGYSDNHGNFCIACGAPRSGQATGQWICPSCGYAGNSGMFCTRCGTHRP